MRKIIWLLGWMVLGVGVMGQDQKQGDYRVMVTPTQFLFNDYALTVEKGMGRHTIGVSLGYRPSVKEQGEVDGVVGMLGDYEYQNMWNGLYEAATLGLNTRYRLGRQQKYYAELQLFYRNWWFDNKQASYPNKEGYRFEGLRSEEQNVYGVKLLAGRSYRLTKGDRGAWVLDLYAGLGLRYKSLWFKTTDGKVGDEYFGYRVDTGHRLNLGPQAGVRIGYERFKR